MGEFILYLVMYAGTPRETWTQQTFYPVSYDNCMTKKKDLDIWLKEKPGDFRDPDNIQFICSPPRR